MQQKHKPYFEGWYFKCRTKDGKTIALIPAIHKDGNGQGSASLQVISEAGTWWLEYPEADFHISGTVVKEMRMYRAR